MNEKKIEHGIIINYDPLACKTNMDLQILYVFSVQFQSVSVRNPWRCLLPTSIYSILLEILCNCHETVKEISFAILISLICPFIRSFPFLLFVYATSINFLCARFNFLLNSLPWGSFFFFAFTHKGKIKFFENFSNVSIPVKEFHGMAELF